jgi:hypothetical protein
MFVCQLSAAGFHFIMSDSVSANSDVFEAGKFCPPQQSCVNIALGSLIMSPSSVVLQDFVDYLNKKYRDVKAGRVTDRVIHEYVSVSDLLNCSFVLDICVYVCVHVCVCVCVWMGTCIHVCVCVCVCVCERACVHVCVFGQQQIKDIKFMLQSTLLYGRLFSRAFLMGPVCLNISDTCHQLIKLYFYSQLSLHCLLQ